MSGIEMEDWTFTLVDGGGWSAMCKADCGKRALARPRPSSGLGNWRSGGVHAIGYELLRRPNSTCILTENLLVTSVTVRIKAEM